jgi:hypothetical protein
MLINLSLVFIPNWPTSPIDTKARLFDVISGSNWEDAMARMDNYAIQLQNETAAIGVIIVYGGQYGRRDEPQAWGKCLRDYLINRRGINTDRIVLLNGGYRESLTAEMWESASKEYTPTLQPTIDAKKVRFRKGKIKNWRSLCNI